MINRALLIAFLALALPHTVSAEPQESELNKYEICITTILFLDSNLAPAASCLCDYIDQGIPGDIAMQYCSHLLLLVDTGPVDAVAPAPDGPSEPQQEWADAVAPAPDGPSEPQQEWADAVAE